MTKMVNDIILRIVVILFIFSEYLLVVGSDEVDSLRQFKNVNTLNYSTCGSKFPITNVPLCHCDALCTYYNDCCYVYAQNESRGNETTNSMDKVLRTECVNLDGDQNSYLMHSVPVPSVEITARASLFVEPCQVSTRTNHFGAIPVYSSQVKATFRNDFCLKLFMQVMNSQYKTESLVFWSVTMPEGCFQTYLSEFKTRQPIGSYMDFLAVVFSHKYCNLTLVPTEKTTRICFQQEADGCKDKDICHSYQSPVADESGKIFKNEHCAACAGSHEISSLKDKEPVDDRKTFLTLYQLSRGFEPHTLIRSLGPIPNDPCQTRSSIATMFGCNLTCPDDQMRYFNTCINPIAKVRGFLQLVEVKTSSSKSLPLDQKEKITRAVLSMIDPIADFYVSSKAVTARTKSSGCLHIIEIAIYLRYDVINRDYLNISTHVRKILENRKNELENEILNLTMNGEPCLPVGTSNSDGSSALRQTAMTDTIKVIIFSSIFGVFVLAIVAVTVIKGIMNKLARNRDTEANE